MCPTPTHLGIKLSTIRTWITIFRKKFSLNLAQHLSCIHALFPLLNGFLWEQFTWPLPSFKISELDSFIHESCTIDANHKKFSTKLMLVRMNKPEMVISINCLATAVTKILSAVVANHLIATLSPRYCHFTRWALLGITKYFLDTNKLIDHLTFLSSLLTT